MGFLIRFLNGLSIAIAVVTIVVGSFRNLASGGKS
jgi:hypothetical protein